MYLDRQTPPKTRNQSRSRRKGVVNHVSGLKRKGCPGTLSLSVGFIANDPGGQLLFASASNPSTWNSGDVYTQQQSTARPAVAVAPLAYNPVFPASNSARINYLITNYNQIDPLQNITVTVVAIQDFVNAATYNAQNYEPVGNPVTTGFSFQLNCQPPGTIPNTGSYPPSWPECLGAIRHIGPGDAVVYVVREQFERRPWAGQVPESVYAAKCQHNTQRLQDRD
jgi:hypothetical protein